MKLVSAIVRKGKLEEVEKALAEIGVPDVSVSKVTGFAGTRMLTSRELTPHMRVDVIVPESQAEHVADCICAASCTGLAGDGIIFVIPVDKIVKIRMRRFRESGKHHGAG